MSCLPAPLYLLGSRYRDGDDEHRLVHVVSPAAGGEVCGFRSVNGGPFERRTPWYVGDWPAVETAVATLSMWEEPGADGCGLARKPTAA